MGNEMNYLTVLLSLLEKIPATFWGVVVGAILTLGGVVLTNRANDRRLRAQFDHDRKIRNRERELSLRKEIYLAATEAVSAGLTAIGRFANLDIPHDQIAEDYLNRSPSIAKVYVVSTEATGRAVAALTGELSAAYLRLSAKRIPLIAHKQQIAFLAEQMVAFGRERDRMLDLMKQYNIQGQADQRLWNVINNNFQFEQTRITDVIKNHSELASKLSVKQIDYAQECMIEVIRLTRLQLPALVAVRTELELPIDEDAYSSFIEDGLRRQEASMRDFLAEIQRLSVPTPSDSGDAQQVKK